MIYSKLDIKNWSYDGRKLAKPMVILRRLSMYPFYHFVRYVLAFIALLGWGTYEAEHILEETS